MNVLIIGSGAREHAFCWKIKQSKKPTNLFVIPGNAGTAELAKNVNIPIDDFKKIKEIILKHKIQLLIIGPEIPLINGLSDFVKNDNEIRNTLLVGPSKNGSRLEGSKDFSKEFMLRHNIPTAPYKTFHQDSLKEGIKYLSEISPPYVLKADGPAAGKGVLIINDLFNAKEELINMLSNNKFGKSGHKVVIEGFLEGIELSCFLLFDGESYLNLPNAKDYKRIGDGDLGLNTGGMGSISPVPFADKEFISKVEKKIIKPTIDGIIKDGIDYVGFLFIGIIKVDDEPYVIEYNVRMGDPETQVVLPRIKNDFLDMMINTANGNLKSITLETEESIYANVVMVSGGYPQSYEKGKKIIGLDQNHDSIILHAGTKKEGNQILTNGGRVLSIISKSSELSIALKKSYNTISSIDFDKKYYRKDIGFDL
ncbi:MAG: phosphoribosylamine--glycine ligase [Flavobacteriaceae bacterium]|mgnify:CR=1 FL=1|nr:phosphoribosylamine--glycine ligase [Flavobacteriaceae bacterium]|tara:strand:- start:20543 stop:21814 length:1272 start_codon:yes stop_codon:yes gene_type:complete